MSEKKKMSIKKTTIHSVKVETRCRRKSCGERWKSKDKLDFWPRLECVHQTHLQTHYSFGLTFSVCMLNDDC